MTDDINSDINSAMSSKMTNSIKALKECFSRIRSGRAHPSILDGVVVEYYGSQAPLNQVSSVTVEEGRTLNISVWEKNMVEAIEKAILKADLGLNPQSAGTSIRLPMPPLTEETRRHLVKQVSLEAEKCRVAIRNHRRAAIADLKDCEKEKFISEDDLKSGQIVIQKTTDNFISQIDSLVKDKEQSLLEV